MFSQGQTIFAILFAITFIIIIVFMYLKDKSTHKQQYKGVKWVLLGFLLFILLYGLLENV